MKSWSIAILILAVLIIGALVGLLITASYFDMNLIELIQSWFPVKETGEAVETASRFITNLKI